MTASFYPRMVNSPFGDPGLFVPFCSEKRAVAFDLGDISPLSTRDILKISHCFISHTHMDHFIGLDHMLRIMLGRTKKLCLFGPEGFLENLEGKLAGYSWNLVENYDNHFVLQATEVHPAHLLTRNYICQNMFRSSGETERKPFNDLLLDKPSFSVSSVILDHSIPCLGFLMKEAIHINIKKIEVQKLGLDVGPWLNEFKNALFEQKPPDTLFEVVLGTEKNRKASFRLQDLTEKIAKITPGRKIAYITDVQYNDKNMEKIIPFITGVDHLFIEAAFSEKHKDIAHAKNHLTARQAGEIAGKAGVGRFTIFHFSPRYTDEEKMLQMEAEAAYQAAFTA